MNSILSSTYPTDLLLAIYQNASEHITNHNPFMIYPEFYNNDSGRILEYAISNGLGGIFQINTAHYYGAQSVAAFDETNLSTVTIQSAATKTIATVVGERKIVAEFEISTIDYGITYDNNEQYFAQKMRNINKGIAQSVNEQIYSYTLDKFKSSNMLYAGWLDTTHHIYVPHGSPYATYKNHYAPYLTSDGVFNLQSLDAVFAEIRQVTGDGVEGDEYPYFSVMRRAKFKTLAVGQSNVFTPELTMEAYRASIKDKVEQFQNTPYSLTSYDVMNNFWISSNPNWAIPTVDNTTGVPNGPQAAAVFTLTSFAIDLAGNMTGVITSTTATPGTSVLGYNDVFVLDSGAYNFILAGNSLSTEGMTLALTLDKPNNYDPNNKSTWVYTAGGVADAATFTVNFVNTLRPLVSINGEITPLGNDPNCDIIVNFTDPTLATPAAINAGVSTALTGQRFDPKVGNTECALYMQCVANYQFPLPKIDAPNVYMNMPLPGNVMSNFFAYAAFTGDKDIIKSSPFPLSYQVFPTALYTMNVMRLLGAHTAVFDNYTLRTGAVALYKS